MLYAEEYKKIKEMVLSEVNNFGELRYLIDRIGFHLNKQTIPPQKKIETIVNQISDMAISPGIAIAILEQIGYDIERKIYQLPIEIILKP